ncbi:hypothetical protein A8924_5996 [Saccharopolyspora erythraea NRRL 2338]|uniref:Uncharacterized protein n=1 Tax=Saccharopolyspora erythraea (strain ATCC 11635 / DSM 40517 / JCM 4748 / NBRC 13426 / NCIMB 8594 / NRRL 2338) TaxID=405948 RepID=A4FLB7_SACEN|nr:hypothetical protein N599_23360 [Saccharopolyspora erythraea D]PFG98481.1 hypothetical protein A8924_5996 [Saccharopolyspora erythraea NRRL 2338]CAM04842.1 hypothetical protein SACE_5656 [Saccharopolyspora erythraea NRRL 2338]
MTDDTERSGTRWKLVLGHILAWPLLALGAAAVITLYVIANQGYEGFGVEQGIATTFFMVFVLASAIGTLILVTVTGWRHPLSRLVVSAEVLLLLGAIISLVVGPK